MKTLAHCDLVVIGGGPAGMMCAYQAAAGGHSVIMLDGNRQLGRKLRITGKGRCNLTNNCTVRDFMQNIPGDGRFLYSALNRFSPADVMTFFEEHGVPTRADSVLLADGAVSAVHTPEGTISCRAAALCTGGLSYPLTGSDGAGYRMACALGHTLTPTRPSLVPLESDDAFCRDLQGFSLKNVTLRVYEDDKLIFRELGEMLFTHFGVSGPLVLSASAHMRKFSSCTYRLEIDLKPGLDEEKLDARILRDFAAQPNKTLANLMPGLTGRSMAPVVLSLAGVDGSIPANSLRNQKCGRGHCHRGRHQHKGSEPAHHGIQNRAGALFCRGDSGRGCLYRRIQSSDCLGHRLHRRYGRLR